MFAFTRNKLQLIVILLLLQSKTFAAEPFKYALTAQYNRNSGLAFTLINQVCQSPDGLIWIATNQGLYKFDGRNFKTVPLRHNRPNSKPFVRIFGQINDDLYASFSYNKKDFVFKIKNGRCDSGIILKNHYSTPYQFGFFEKNQIPSKYYGNFTNGPLIKGNNKQGYYIQTMEGDLYYGKLKKYTKIFSSKDFMHTSVFHDALYYTVEIKNNFCIISKFKDGVFVKKYILKDLVINTQKRDVKIFCSNNHIYLYNNKFIYELLESSTKNISLEKLFQLPDNFVVSDLIFSKLEGAIIITSKTQGVLIYGIARHTLINSKSADLSETPINIVYAFQPLSNNRFLTVRGILGLNESYSNITKFSDAFNIPRSNQGKLILPKGNKLYVCDSLLNKLFPLTPIELDGNYPDAYCCSEKYVFILWNKYIFIYDHDFKFIKKIITKLNQNVRFVHYTNNNLILCCYLKTYKYNLTSDQLTEIQALKNLQVDNITRIRGVNLLFINENGWGYLSNDKLYKLPLDNNKYLSTAHTAIEDNDGYIWISTNTGLFNVKTSQLLAYIANRSPFHIAGPYLTNVEFNGGCSPATLKLNNVLVFPSLNGLYMINTSIFHRKINPYFHLDNIYLDNQLVELNNLYIKPDFNQISFLFDMPLFDRQDMYLVQYRLNAFDSWYTVGVSNEIKFDKLAGGEYQLEVRILDIQNNEVITSQYYNFFVNHYWYKNIRFYVGLIIAVSALLIAFILYQRKRLINRQIVLEKRIEERTAEIRNMAKKYEKTAHFKERLSQLIIHDITSPLIFLKSLSTRLVKSAQNNTDLGNLHNGINNLFRYSENLNSWLKNHNQKHELNVDIFKLDDVFAELKEDYQALAQQKSLLLIFKNECKIDVLNVKQVLTIILRNLIDNAIKFSEKGKIEIHAKANSGEVTIEVSDQGVGMEQKQIAVLMENAIDAEYLSSGLGFKIIFGILERINGNIKIESEIDKGTTFILSFPVFLNDADTEME